MKCHEWQETILTDYLDNEIDSERKKQLEGHLSDCQACREFLAIARKTVLKPFEKIPQAQPSEKVWRNIQEATIEKKHEDTASAWERLKDMVLLPKPALAFATVLAGLMAVTVTMKFYHQGFLAQSDVEPIEYALDELAAYDVDNHLYEPTPIEEYFL